MNISADNLINFLKNDDIVLETKEIKILEKNKTDNFSNIEKFNNIFDDYVERYGITSYYRKQNISFLFSFLFLVDNEYYSFTEKEKLEYISALKKKKRNEETKKNLLKNLNLTGNGWNKKTLLELIKNDIINNNYIYYIASYFNINIFVIDINKNIIIPFYNDDLFTIYKTNIIISLYNDIYEPIVYVDGSKQFLYNSAILQKIINSNKISMPSIGFTKVIKLKQFEINNKLDSFDNKITENEITENEITENEITENNHPVYKINDIDIELEINTISEEYNTEHNNFENKYKSFSLDELLNTYKKPELIKICKELKIPYSNKNKKVLAKNILDK